MAVAKKTAPAATPATIEAAVEQVVETTKANTEAVVSAATEMMKPFAEMKPFGEIKPFADMQENFRAQAEKTIEQMRTQYTTLKGNAEVATGKLEESMTAAQAGTREFNAKVFELFRAQTTAGFDHLQALFGAKTLADAVKLQQDFAKVQVEAIQTSTKSLAELAKKVATDVVEPVKASIVLPFKR
ncbi:phasin family protein [Rhabdaerophilum sp. SD176]|uniref:phasin family protein n=1 Tax=Rhabdaerophilum sp. SD176 TaxID=2983548 RepID=UPI0024DFB521|nr:phasin family protein [Rhabdaerophilum sp. SD176]